MKIAIIGYGKMGKMIETIALKTSIYITAVIDSENDWTEKTDQLDAADVAIEFTTPQVAPENILKCFSNKLPVVSGTTGWDDRLTEIKSACYQSNGALLFSPNFSIGVNIFFALNKYLAGLMNKTEEYDVTVEETHHIHKLDAPSGTAKALANDLLELIDRKKQWVSAQTNNADDLLISSHRLEEVHGTHLVRYFSEIDEIEIKHTAKSREGFAVGALNAARWLIGKKGFYTMEDMMKWLFEIKIK
jgi:4-hydroxy-tetrahydrodipicolinate reductase